MNGSNLASTSPSGSRFLIADTRILKTTPLTGCSFLFFLRTIVLGTLRFDTLIDLNQRRHHNPQYYERNERFHFIIKSFHHYPLCLPQSPNCQ